MSAKNPDRETTVVGGLLGSILGVVDYFSSGGTFTLEGVAVAVAVAVLGFFSGGRKK